MFKTKANRALLDVAQAQLLHTVAKCQVLDDRLWQPTATSSSVVTVHGKVRRPLMELPFQDAVLTIIFVCTIKAQACSMKPCIITYHQLKLLQVCARPQGICDTVLKYARTNDQRCQPAGSTAYSVQGPAFHPKRCPHRPHPCPAGSGCEHACKANAHVNPCSPSSLPPRVRCCRLLCSQVVLASFVHACTASSCVSYASGVRPCGPPQSQVQCCQLSEAAPDAQRLPKCILEVCRSSLVIVRGRRYRAGSRFNGSGDATHLLMDRSSGHALQCMASTLCARVKGQQPRLKGQRGCAAVGLSRERT